MEDPPKKDGCDSVWINMGQQIYSLYIRFCMGHTKKKHLQNFHPGGRCFPRGAGTVGRQVLVPI